MSNLEEIKSAITESGKAFEEFKKLQKERLDELAKKGEVTGELQQKMERVEKALDDAQELKTRLEKLEVSAKRETSIGEFNSAEELEAKADFVKYLRTAKPSQAMEEGKSLSVGSDPDGGYLVTPDMSGRISQIVFETSPIRGYASVQTIGTDALEGLFDDGEAGAEWVSETVAPTNTTTPTLGKWRIPVNELATRPQATNKLIEDSNVDIESWLIGKVSDKFARTQNLAFVSGDGVGKPRGFLSYDAASTADVYERGKIGQVSSGSAAALTENGLLDLVYSLKAEYRSSPSCGFAMSRSTQGSVRKLADSEGQLQWQPGLVLGQPATLLGFPVVEMNDMPDVAADALSIAFADWSRAYQIVDRLGVSVLRDPYTAKPYVEFYVRQRVGGDVINFDAIKIQKVEA